MAREADVYQWLAEAGEWWCLLGRPDQPLATISEARENGLSGPAFKGPNTVLASSAAPADRDASVTDILERFAATLDSDAQEVLASRIVARPPMTLRELAETLDASHEYIRKVQGRIQGKYEDLLEGNAALNRLAEQLETLGCTVCAEQTLGEWAPALAEEVPALGVPALAVLSGFSGDYQVKGGWYLKPDRDSAIRATRDYIAQNTNRFGTVSLAALANKKDANFPLSPEQWNGWLTECGVDVEEGIASLPATNMADAAAAILFGNGSPLTSEELIDRFPQKRSKRSVRNQLSADERFVRVDVDSWGLSEWEDKPYEGIRAAIGDKVAEEGGAISLTRLVKLLTEQFSVASASVVSYAASPPFQTRKGMVSRREGEVEAEVAPEATANVYRGADSWVYRTQVKPAHFRGGGGRIPMGIATALKMKFGDRVDLPAPFGTQQVYWTGQQPRLGTLRRPIEAMGLQPGDQIFLHFSDRGVFDVRALPPSTGDPLADALALVGFDSFEGEEAVTSDPLGILSKSLGVPQVLSPINLVSAFEDRGDKDVAALIREAYFGDLLTRNVEPPALTSEQPALF